MMKFLPFASIYVSLQIFVTTFPVIMLATTPFVALQYAMLPNSVDQEIKAQESLAVLVSLNNSLTTKNLFTSINQSEKILPLYTPLEVNHLVDVKKRFDAVRLAAIVSLILLSTQAYVFRRAEFTKHVYTSSIFGLLVVAVAGIALLFSWEWFFVTFHQALFPGGNWSFSETSGLIQLFPEMFWFRFGTAWIGMILFMLLTLTLISKSVINRSSPN